MKRIATTFLAVVLLAGCGNDDSTEPGVPGPTDTVVVFERVGGFAGVRERLDVRPDGAARLTRGTTKVEAKRFTLTERELNDLRAARDRVDFDRLEPSYGPEQPVADGVASTVTIDGREVTVFTEGEPPPEVEHLIDVCAAIVEAHAPR